MVKIWGLIRSILLRFLTISTALFLFILLPTFFLFTIPIYLYRCIVAQLAKWFRPQFGSIVTPRAAPLAVDDIYGSPDSTVCMSVTLEEEEVGSSFDLQSLISRFHEKVTSIRSPKGDLAYPELQQSLTQWLGFHFWVWDISFDLQNHFKADGYSIFACLMRFFSDDPKYSPEDISTVVPTNPYKGINWIWTGLRLIFESPYAIAQVILEHSDWINNLHPPPWRVTKEVTFGRMEPFPISFVKEIKDSYKVNFNSVLLAGISACFRSYLISRDPKGVCPKEFLHVGIALPAPANKSHKLRNNVTGGIVRLPVGLEDSVERLKFIDSDLNRMKTSIFPLAAYYLVPLGGVQLAPLLRIALNSGNSLITAAATIFPGPNCLQFVNDRKVVDLRYSGGLFKGNIGVLIPILSYNGFVRIYIEVDKVISDSEFNMDKLMTDFKKELFILKTRGVA